MKNISIVWKMVLAFLLVAITAIGIVAVVIRLTSANRLANLILDQQRSSLQTALVSYYKQRGSWKGVNEKWQQVQAADALGEMMSMPMSGNPGNGNGGNRGQFGEGQGMRDRRALFGLANEDGIVIVAVMPGFPLGKQLNAFEIRQGIAIETGGRQVGTILTANLPPILNSEENLFLRRTSEALGIAALGAVLIALLIGVVLARTLISPLQALTQASQRMAAGEWEQQVAVQSQDEIGQLALAFNRMSAELTRVHSQRKQMTADIAHDLRTPLTVIAGYVESMRDGVLKATPERLTVIYTEIERLQDLVNDLRMLSLADAGALSLHLQPISPQLLLQQAVEPFQHHADKQAVHLYVEPSEKLPDVLVDEMRMMQVFGNLITNSLRYTPQGGEIQLSAVEEVDQVVLRVMDNGAGIAAEDLPFIFDRFSRAETSRHSDAGESGLGLAIVKALAEAQGGRVSAQSALGEGTTIEIRMPKS